MLGFVVVDLCDEPSFLSRFHDNLIFSDLLVFVVVKNPNDLRSQVRFWILPKNAPWKRLFPRLTSRDLNFDNKMYILTSHGQLGSGSTGLTKFVWPVQKSRQNLSLQIFNLVIVGALKIFFFRSCRVNCKICTV